MSKQMAFDNRRFHIAALTTVLILIVIAWLSAKVVSEFAVASGVHDSIQPKFGSIESQEDMDPSMTQNDVEVEQQTQPVAKADLPKRNEVPRKEASAHQRDQPTPVSYGAHEQKQTAIENETAPPDRNAATALEEQPKSVNEMSSAEVEVKVAEYKKWIAKGLIRVSFNYERIPVDQMHKIADQYFLASRSYTYRTDRFGVSSTEVIGNPEIKGLAIGLSKYRSEWPSPAIELEKNMGTLREAYFVVQGNVALELYRCIGRAGKDADLENKTVSVEIALVDGAVVARVANIK